VISFGVIASSATQIGIKTRPKRVWENNHKWGTDSKSRGLFFFFLKGSVDCLYIELGLELRLRIRRRGVKYRFNPAKLVDHTEDGEGLLGFKQLVELSPL
jgi:hypothetical protein